MLDSNTSGRLKEALAEAVPLLCCNGVPEALQAAFQLADPGFAAPLAQALQVLYGWPLCNQEHADHFLWIYMGWLCGASPLRVLWVTAVLLTVTHTLQLMSVEFLQQAEVLVDTPRLGEGLTWVSQFQTLQLFCDVETCLRPCSAWALTGAASELTG